MVSSGRNEPPNGIAVEEPSICSAENRNSEEEGERPSVNGRPEGLRITGHCSRTRSNRSPLAAGRPRLRPNAGGRRFRISLEIRYDRIYEPYALSRNSPRR